jgi:hypothetical protein
MVQTYQHFACSAFSSRAFTSLIYAEYLTKIKKKAHLVATVNDLWRNVAFVFQLVAWAKHRIPY